MKIICFDAEFANEAGYPEEILELSIWQTEALGPDAPKRQVFHQYFRPVEHRRWPHSQSVHHISPAMVAGKPHFAEWRRKIQQIVDEADLIVGFALENDITALEREGIKRIAEKPAVDVRDLHWLQNTRHQGVDLNSRKNLAVTAGDLGVEFSENLAHGADYDTRITLECFQTLIAAFRRDENPEGDEAAVLDRYAARWVQERENFLREYAHGWVALVKWHEGYRLKASRMAPPKGEGVEKVIEVGARYRALDEIDARFDRLRDPRDARVYRLGKKELAWFAAYANEYDGSEPLHKKMSELRVAAAKGLG